MSYPLLLIAWIIVSIILGLALGRILEECETRECQHRNAPSPTTQHTAQDAEWTT